MAAGERVIEYSSGMESWWELSYAHYLTVPRSAIQSMPVEWQDKFAALLEELDRRLDWRPKRGRYHVQLRDERGAFCRDPLAPYRNMRPMPTREE